MDKKPKNYLKKIIIIILATTTFNLNCINKECKNILQYSTLNSQAVKESLIPIRPGIPEKSPFWNEHSRRFIYVPAFNFKTINGAVSYRFTAKSIVNSKEYTFKSQQSWVPLTPIWKELPVGEIVLKVQGYDKTGQAVGTPTTRNFYRAAVFKGPYHKPTLNYQESARRALEYLFNLEHYQNWIKVGKPDSSYELYCYPSKIIGAVIESMLMYSKLSPSKIKHDALIIAQNAAEYLISISEPEGGPLEFFPPTYIGSKRTAKKYKGQVMMVYPAKVGNIYLDLYEVTKNKKYFEAAKKIADIYAKIQLPSGTWVLKAHAKTGIAVTTNVCIPIDMINLFDRLANQYGLEKYRKNSKLAFRWIMENPIKTFNWEAQFEDMEPSKPYRNLARGHASLVAVYLLHHSKENPQYIEQAEEILKFAEDQFIVWENPMPQEEYCTDKWITPCVLEQYGFYTPIDASASTMINAYQKAYEVTGKDLYLAKACALANTMTVAQDRDTGRYPTYWNCWWDKAGWINCATYDCKVMINFGEMLAKIQLRKADN